MQTLVLEREKAIVFVESLTRQILARYTRCSGYIYPANSESIRFLASMWNSALISHAPFMHMYLHNRRPQSRMYIATRACVYINICACKWTRYNMHYRSQVTPRQFSMSLMPEFCNETNGASLVVIVIAHPAALYRLLHMLSDHYYIDKTIGRWSIFLYHSILVRRIYRATENNY